jgi:hypothetical protein
MRAIVVVAIVLGLSVVAAAQTKEELQTIDAWLLGGKDDGGKREAAVVALLNSKPALAKGSKDGQPLLAYALGTVTVSADLGRRSRKLAELLIAKGADVNVKVDKMPLLVKFGMFAQIEPMQILLSKGANPDAADADSRTALHWLATAGEVDKEPGVTQRNIKAATLLLDRKAKINAKDKWGKTPLHIAAFVGSKKLCELLLARGADINAKDKDGYSVLGACRLRVGDGKGRPTFANAKEKDATRAVIQLLSSKGAKDERPR